MTCQVTGVSKFLQAQPRITKPKPGELALTSSLNSTLKLLSPLEK